VKDDPDNRILECAVAGRAEVIVTGDKALLALGYVGWAPGQLESEITANGWLNCPADPELIFDPEVDRKYYRALGKIGIDPIRLVNDSGHA
jgi:putative transcriptional regulator